MVERVVLDADAALTWVLPTDRIEQREYAGALIRADLVFVVPALWHVEMAALLLRARRAKTISASTYRSAIEIIKGLPIETHAVSPTFDELLSLAVRFHVQPADAIYLDLARSLRLPIASLDGGVRTACRAHGVELFQPSIKSTAEKIVVDPGVTNPALILCRAQRKLRRRKLRGTFANGA